MIDLRLGDCLDILPTLPAQSVDAVICDPPYGTTACKWDSVIPFAPMWEALRRLIKPRGAIVLFGAQPFTSALVMSWPQGYRHCWVWDKRRVTGGALADRSPMRAHEDVLVFGVRAPKYTPQMGSWANITITRIKPALVKRDNSFAHADNYSPGREEKLARGRYPDTVLRIPALGSQDGERTGHPTQKPVALMEYLVRTYTGEGDTVLDFTMGSGTTGVACVNTGRSFIGIERDAGYYAIAERRIAEAQQQTRMAV